MVLYIMQRKAVTETKKIKATLDARQHKKRQKSDRENFFTLKIF